MKDINYQDEQDALWEATANLGNRNLDPTETLPDHLKIIESEKILTAMMDNNYVIAKAARELGISRERLHHRIKALRLRF
jgi:transcriptional regulator of acetoin/glycerol metabolism